MSIYSDKLAHVQLHFLVNLPRVNRVFTLNSEQVHYYLASSFIPNFKNIFYFN